MTRKSDCNLSSAFIPLIAVCVGLLGNVDDTRAEVMDFFGEIEGDAPEGYRDYVEMGCWQCHGFQGQSTGGDGPQLAPGVLPFDAFVLLVRKPSGEMPAYSPKVLRLEKLRRIYEYLESIPSATESATDQVGSH